MDPVSTQERTITKQPVFSHAGYADLLDHLSGLGYELLPASLVGHTSGRAVFLRHDIDMHVAGALEFAAIEEARGANSTWYVQIDGHYNPLAPAARAELLELKDRGHTLGLHYTDPLPVRTFEMTFGRPSSIAMHRPSRGGTDPWRQHPLNPHRTGIFYVSDSRREWTEPYLSTLLSGEPEQAMLSTHHEHWTTGLPRMEHFEHAAMMARRPTDDFLQSELDAWISGR